ncbi:YARHG domain-containing protein [Butyrivibrio sp. AC2005]|uniref:YARHG domain-containing protein n=1 Tax=Butyrivibrio sp. AC2005 TaxID=1280672 RepID=UPI0003F75E63|nr:YARHG domain-containing protein [Butyrivibrio sp. AC2005]
MKKRISVLVITCMLFCIMVSKMAISIKAANISKEEIKQGAVSDFSYKNVMRYRDKYVGKYVVIPMCIGSVVGNTDNAMFDAAIIEYDETYKNNIYYNFDEEFIINNNKYDKSLSWVEGDYIIVYGKYMGIATYYTTNPYTDKQDPIDIPVIDVYYDVLTDDPFDSSLYSSSNSTGNNNANNNSNNSNNANNNSNNSSEYDDYMAKYNYYNSLGDRYYSDGTELTIGYYGDPGDDWDEYVLYGSDGGYYGREYLEQFSSSDLRIARNEIYARHGRMFSSSDLQNYFNSKSWYTPIYSPEEFDALGDSVLNKYEKANRDIIAAIEASRK